MKRIFLSVISTVAVFSAAAQTQNSISQQIEVTREYRPDVERADKLTIDPDMADTVSLKPEVEYSITPTPWKTVFDTGPISPVRISTAEYIPAWPFYIRLGGGFPGMTLLDVYATMQNAKGTYAGLYVNHYGEWMKLRNDLGSKLPAQRQRNTLGGFFGTRLGKRDLNINLSLDSRKLKAFGFFNDRETDPTAGDPENVLLNALSFDIAYGDSFKDFSKFNFRLGASANYFFNPDENIFTIGGNAAAGFSLGRGMLSVDAMVDHRKGGGNMGAQSNTVISAVPKFDFISNNFDLSLGLLLAGDIYTGRSDFFVAPMVTVKYGIENLFTLYARADGELSAGNFLALSYENPYIINGSWLDNGSRIGFRAGLFGSISSFLSYDIFGGLDTYDNYYYYVNNASRFEAIGGISPNIYYGGVMLKARLARGLNLGLSAKVNGVNEFAYDGEARPGIGVPSYEAEVFLRYDYDEKLFISLGCEFIGKRQASEYYYSTVGTTPLIRTVAIPSAVNLKAEVEYRLVRYANIFVSADNLLNQRIYRFNHYPQMGANVMAGVKIRF